VLAVPRLCEFYPGICLPTEEKARKNLSQCSRSVIHITYYQNTHILQNYTHTHTYYKTHTYTHITKHTHTHTHTLQNNIKPPQYKLKQTQYKIYPNENSHKINKYSQYKDTIMYIAPLCRSN